MKQKPLLPPSRGFSIAERSSRSPFISGSGRIDTGRCLQLRFHHPGIKIVYHGISGTGNYSEFVYDGLWRNTKITEYSNNTATNTRQFVWCSTKRCDERDAAGNVTKRFFASGQSVSAASYFYAKDFLGSVRELTDASGNVQAEYFYQPFGETMNTGALEADFQWAGYYKHARSQNYLTLYRMLSPNIGRWLNPDPAENAVGNLFAYAANDPIGHFDPFGLQQTNNCFGYAMGENRSASTPYGSSMQPSGSQTFMEFFTAHGWKCNEITPQNPKCERDQCKNEQVMIVAFFVMDPRVPAPDQPLGCSAGTFANDYLGVHAIGQDVPVGEGGTAMSGWSQIPENVPVNQKPASADAEALKNDPRVFKKYCCKK